MADLRLFDPIDTPSPSMDILALYTRMVGFDMEIRIDFLDLSLVPDSDCRIRLGTFSGEFEINIPAEGRPTTTPSMAGIKIRLVRDSSLDTIIVRFNRVDFRQPFTLQAFSFLPGQVDVIDETRVTRSDSLSPSSQVPVEIAFWNVFPAFSPAQALRRWDGAHTGPNGGRHGLKHILDSVGQFEVPVALLDITTPASLAALDFEGALPQLQHLVQDDLILLADSGYSQPVDMALKFSRMATLGHGLPTSSFIYSPGMDQVQGYLASFLSMPTSAHLSLSGGMRIIPLPSTELSQATANGPTLDLRRTLVSVLQSEDPGDLVVLGGSLPDSNWADTDMAFPTFGWLAGHPWIHVMDKNDLLTFPASEIITPPEAELSKPDAWLETLRQAPQNSITQSAWQMYLQLHTPKNDNLWQSLRETYSGQIGFLLAAADWLESPISISDCSTDPDQDGLQDCLLANDRYFAVIEMNGARLLYLFFLGENGAHQLVAPTAQFMVGISDPSQWHPEQGDAADPGSIMGAFSDDGGYYDEYDLLAGGDDHLSLINLDRVTKTYRLGESGLEVTYETPNAIRTLIPLAVDPQEFYFRTTDYIASLQPGKWTWGPAGGSKVIIRSDADISAEAFTSSRLFLGKPEDPNQQFPRGHYFPFPFSLVTVEGEGIFTVWIEGR